MIFRYVLLAFCGLFFLIKGIWNLKVKVKKEPVEEKCNLLYSPDIYVPKENYLKFNKWMGTISIIFGISVVLLIALIILAENFKNDLFYYLAYVPIAVVSTTAIVGCFGIVKYGKRK